MNIRRLHDGTAALRATAAWIALVAMPALAWACFTVTAGLAARWTPMWRVEDVIVLAAAACATVIASYLALLGAAMLASSVLGRRRWEQGPARMAPPAWRRVAATALGITLATGVAGPALATEGGSDAEEAPLQITWVATPGEARPTEPVVESPPSATPATENQGVVAEVLPAVAGNAAEPQVGTMPDQTGVNAAEPGAEAGASVLGAEGSGVGARVHAPAASSPPGRGETSIAILPNLATEPARGSTLAEPTPVMSTQNDQSETYTVARGDSLWKITADLLGPGATSEEVAQAWPNLYHANRDVVGADPGLICAGQVLVIPGSLA